MYIIYGIDDSFDVFDSQRSKKNGTAENIPVLISSPTVVKIATSLRVRWSRNFAVSITLSSQRTNVTNLAKLNNNILHILITKNYSKRSKIGRFMNLILKFQKKRFFNVSRFQCNYYHEIRLTTRDLIHKLSS